MREISIRLAVCAAIVSLALGAQPAAALDQLRLGKAVPNSFAFGAADVGVAAGIFAKEGIDLDITGFGGDAKLQQGMAAGSIDMGSAPARRWDFMPRARRRSPSRRCSGRRPIWRSGPRRLADQERRGTEGQAHRRHDGRLAHRLARPRAVAPAGLGKRRHEDPGARLDRGADRRPDHRRARRTVQEAANGYELEEQGKTRNLLLFGDLVKNFYTHVIFATDDMVAKRPELLRRFLRGWFETIAYMRANRDFTIASEGKTLGVRESVAAKVYDTQMASFSADGAWIRHAIDAIRRSLEGSSEFSMRCQTRRRSIMISSCR